MGLYFFHANHCLQESKGNRAYSHFGEHSRAVDHRRVGLKLSLDQLYLGKEESISIGCFTYVEGEEIGGKRHVRQMMKNR